MIRPTRETLQEREKEKEKEKETLTAVVMTSRKMCPRRKLATRMRKAHRVTKMWRPMYPDRLLLVPNLKMKNPR